MDKFQRRAARGSRGLELLSLRNLDMALFRTLSAPEPLPPITGDGVVLRSPQMGDYAAWARVREQSRKFLTPWEPTWPADDLTRPAYRQRLAPLRRGHPHRPGLSVLPVPQRGRRAGRRAGARQHPPRRGPGRQPGLLGRRPLCPPRLHDEGGPGARSRWRSILLRLHRLEAACIPTNLASIKLLEKTGFKREGYARSYLCINGIWQDHLLYAKLQSDPRD